MFELNTIYTFKAFEGEGTPELKQAVNALLAAHNLPVITLLNDFNWNWSVDKGEFRGKLPKRIAQWLYKVHGIKVSDDLVSKIGNVARPHVHQGEVYHFDFVSEFNWKDGDFGDSGSCFWGSNYEARQLMADGGVIAIRLYESADSQEGIARAWIAQEGEIYILFNGYCRRGLRLETMDIARVFAAFIGWHYTQVSISNHGRTNGTVWINSGRGYAIHAESVKVSRSYDLGLGAECTCADCGRELSRYDARIGADDETYCEDCFFNAFDYCIACDETHYRDDMIYIEDEGDVCETCLNERFTLCESCQEYRRNRDVFEVKGHDTCRHCM